MKCWNYLNKSYIESTFQLFISVASFVWACGFVYCLFNIKQDHRQWCFLMPNCLDYFLAKTRLKPFLAGKNFFWLHCSLSYPCITSNVQLEWREHWIYEVCLVSFTQWHNKNTLILNRTSNHLYSKKSFLLKISTQILWPIMAYVERHKYLYNILTQLPNVFIVTDSFRFLAVYSLYKCWANKQCHTLPPNGKVM